MMGGLGSGGWNRSGRSTVEQHAILEVSALRRAGALAVDVRRSWSWRHDDSHATTITTTTTTIRASRQLQLCCRAMMTGQGGGHEVVGLVWRPCPFGGERAFF